MDQPSARAIPTAEVLQRLEKAKKHLSNDSLPYNLLNLRDVVEKPIPDILERRRFQLIPSLSDRALSKTGPDSVAGKPHTDPIKNAAGEPYIDFYSCRSFNLYAQRGAVSGCHIDWLNGTWARLWTGLKAWPVMTNLTEQEMEDYKKFESLYLPKKGRLEMIVLEPGDTLIMPPGTMVVHAPITIEDALMDGGMFWDDQQILSILRNIHTVANHPGLSNELVARQFAGVMDSLERWVDSDAKRFAGTRDEKEFKAEFQEILADLKSVISCECAPYCKPAKCPCFQSRSGCSHWCASHKSRTCQQ
ncbi:hypothetical protein BU16DRAFT_468251 [Lophium mytilinum]|uniref:JmjC domain-containing protein n=1 Tax=Lophium mytilinum TaxID=390894 RepID=A0A6A6QFY1_9PEZI|nr:hypothetical protein BU16DRAFT_468251 [Lophium mytilinum]